MANLTPSRVGQINQAGGSFANDNALFLKVFSGEVVTAFTEACIMLPLGMQRSISSGKTAQFPALWKTTAAYHVPGTQLTGNLISSAEITINIDDMLISQVTVPQIDQLKAHFDFRGEYAKQMGLALANTMDKNLLCIALLASRAAAVITSGAAPGGALTNAGYGTTATTLIAGILGIAQTFDQNNIPADDRHVALAPAQYWLLPNASPAIDTRFNLDAAVDNGSIAVGDVKQIGGVKIHKTNHLPNGTTVSAVSGQNNTYNGVFTNTVAVGWHRTAYATVKLLDIAMEMEWQTLYQATLMVAKLAVGHGYLRPEAAIELKTA